MPVEHAPAVAVFDLDGTLIDSDEALAAPFVELGVPREAVTFGHVVAEECARWGFTVDDYLRLYDPARVEPYPGVDRLLAGLASRDVTWAVCSNKDRRFGRMELARLGWAPEVALFADDFAGPKSVEPVLRALGVASDRSIWFVGDTAHDEACARSAGVSFALAAWNPRARASGISADAVLATPEELLDLL